MWPMRPRIIYKLAVALIGSLQRYPARTKIIPMIFHLVLIPIVASRPMRAMRAPIALIAGYHTYIKQLLIFRHWILLSDT